MFDISFRDSRGYQVVHTRNAMGVPPKGTVIDVNGHRYIVAAVEWSIYSGNRTGNIPVIVRMES